MKKDSQKDLTHVTQIDIVVLAVYLLGGAGEPIDTERIAVRCHVLAPGTFAWRLFPDQINLELVRVVLSNAKKKPSGILLQGSGRDGWRLTANGLRWCQEHLSLIKEMGITVSQSRRKAGSIDARRADRERNRVESSDAWRQWDSGMPISPEAAQLLFRIDSYSSGTMVEAKVVRLQAMFESDERMMSFLRQAGNVALSNQIKLK